MHVPNFGGLSGSEDRGGSDNSIQFTNFGRVGARGVTPIDWDTGCAIFKGTFLAEK